MSRTQSIRPPASTVSGKEPTLSSLDDYCREEILSRSKARTRIGF